MDVQRLTRPKVEPVSVWGQVMSSSCAVVQSVMYMCMHRPYIGACTRISHQSPFTGTSPCSELRRSRSGHDIHLTRRDAFGVAPAPILEQEGVLRGKAGAVRLRDEAEGVEQERRGVGNWGGRMGVGVR